MTQWQLLIHVQQILFALYLSYCSFLLKSLWIVCSVFFHNIAALSWGSRGFEHVSSCWGPYTFHIPLQVNLISGNPSCLFELYYPVDVTYKFICGRISWHDYFELDDIVFYLLRKRSFIFSVTIVQIWSKKKWQQHT